MMKTAFGPYTVRIGKSLAPSSWLVEASYGKKGYTAHHTLTSPCAVIDAELYGSVVGTVLVRLDSPDGLCADETYASELKAMRVSGGKLAELTRFVILPGQPTFAIMGAMFHCIYYYTRMLNDMTDLICEVVPRHVAGQKRLLGFAAVAGPKPCDRVGAPNAVLLHRTLESM